MLRALRQCRFLCRCGYRACTLLRRGRRRLFTVSQQVFQIGKEMHTELQLSCPYCLWRVCHEVLCKVTLHATDHVVVRSFPALTDDAEGVILHYRSAADTT